MKILVYGAGVIGSYLTHVLCAAGNDVTLLAHGDWRETLERDFTALRKQKPDFPMPAWDALRGNMPEWETLHRIYKK